MCKNFIRIAIGTLLGIGLLTGLVLLIDCPDPLLWVAYGWSVGALLVFMFSIGFAAAGKGTKYVLNAAYPLMLKSYLFVTLLMAVFFSLLSYFNIWTMPIGVFCLIEAAVLVFFTWRVLAMGAARDEILATEAAVKTNTISWKMVVLDITAVAEKNSAPEAVKRTMEAIRYADPVEHPAVVYVAENIKSKVAALGMAVDAGETEKVSAICTEIEQLVKERANKLMIVR